MSDPREFWFTVEAECPVYGSDGQTVIGHVRPGRRFRALGEGGGWVTVKGPGGSAGFVDAGVAVREEDPAASPVAPVAPEAPQPSHTVGPAGAPTWLEPDPAAAPGVRFEPGTPVVAVDIGNGWVQVTGPGGVGGYAAARDFLPIS